MDPLATEIAHDVSRILELAGVAIIAFGAILTLIQFVRQLVRDKDAPTAIAAFSMCRTPRISMTRMRRSPSWATGC